MEIFLIMIFKWKKKEKVEFKHERLTVVTPKPNVLLQDVPQKEYKTSQSVLRVIKLLTDAFLRKQQRENYTTQHTTKLPKGLCIHIFPPSLSYLTGSPWIPELLSRRVSWMPSLCTPPFLSHPLSCRPVGWARSGPVVVLPSALASSSSLGCS